MLQTRTLASNSPLSIDNRSTLTLRLQTLLGLKPHSRSLPYFYPQDQVPIETIYKPRQSQSTAG